MTFEEDIKRLEPILGKQQARRLFRAWLMEDRDGQEDIYRWVRLRLEQKLGHDLLSAGQFLSLPSKADADGNYFLGNVMQAGKPAYPFGLRDGEMIQHAGIFGRSGAGKTNMVALLLQSFVQCGKPFLLFDWKRNYRDLLASDGLPLEIYTIGRKTRPLHFNPLIPPVGTPPEVWLKKLIEVACNSFYLGEGVSYLLQEAIDQVYRRFGIYESRSPDNYPTMIHWGRTIVTL